MKKELQKIIKKHKLWLFGKDGGERADLSNADLSYADLSYANLSYADLSNANLSNANLSYADLSYANLSYANLKHAHLSNANLSNANLSNADLSYANLNFANLRMVGLRNADLSYADLSYANLSSADLRNVDLSIVTYTDTILNSQCPEEGSYVAWKKCRDNVLVKLLIPEDALRSSATSRKCRASKAVVLDIVGAEFAVSDFDNTFVYEKGKTVSVENFDTVRWNECSTGIHHFITRAEAERF